MYDNIGKKIKVLTKIATIISIVAVIIVGLVLVEDNPALGLVLIFPCPVLCWASSFFMYGFGELVDKVTAGETKPDKDTNTIKVLLNRKNKALSQLYDEDLISEEEYRDNISKEK